MPVTLAYTSCTNITELQDGTNCHQGGVIGSGYGTCAICYRVEPLKAAGSQMHACTREGTAWLLARPMSRACRGRRRARDLRQTKWRAVALFVGELCCS